MINHLKTIYPYIIISVKALIFLLIMYISTLYLDEIMLYENKKIIIVGNKFVSDSKILELAEIEKNISIFDYDIKGLKEKIESIEYIEIAQIGRVLPSSIVIQIIERKPIALVILEDKQYFFDKSKTRLTATKNAINFFPVPIITYKKDTPIQINDSRLLSTIDFVNESKKIYNKLYLYLSEIRMENNNMLLITDDRTEIDLGEENFLHRMTILKAFEDKIKSKRALINYSHINLKIKNQVIVRERRNFRKEL